MAAYSRRRSQQDYTWPGYVDALSSLLMIVIFVLAVFVVTQFYLSDALSGRDQALDKLNKQISELSTLLQLTKDNNVDLNAQLAILSAQLQSSVAERDKLAAQISTAQADKGKAVADLTEEQRLSAEAKATADRLAVQIAALKQEMARIAALLDASEAKIKEQDTQIVDLGQKLNRALANKVEELARYRSEFFGRLREALGKRDDIVIVGDRFVFQSEVLFASGSAELGPEGIVRMAQLADSLIEIGKKIPADLPWILQVDGHTDSKPINTPQFPSNWELSAARAIAVVKFLASRGVPFERLAASGFGENQPLEKGTDPASLAHNRRIELKLTNR